MNFYFFSRRVHFNEIVVVMCIHFAKVLCQSLFFTMIVYLTGSSTNIFSIALILLLIVSFWFPTIISYMIQKRSCSLSTRVNQPFHDMVKIRVIIIENVNIFTIYETLFENATTILPIKYQNKTKLLVKNRKYLVYL